MNAENKHDLTNQDSTAQTNHQVSVETTSRTEIFDMQDSLIGKEPSLSAEQCAELAGVSLDTIEKYVAIGLLTPIPQSPEHPQRDEARYRQADIRSLFYTRKSLRTQLDKDLPSSLELAEDEEVQGVNNLGSHTSGEESLAENSDKVILQAFKSVDALSDCNSGDDQHSATEQELQSCSSNSVTFQQPDSLTTADPAKAESISSNCSLEVASDNSLDGEPSQKMPHSSDQQSSEALENDSRGATKVSASQLSESSNVEFRVTSRQDSSELQQALKDQIEVLKQERDWLRTRVEQLELRGEREQMLLLSESETIRRLVTQRSLTERVLQTLRLPWAPQERK